MHTLGTERFNLDKVSENIESKLQQNELVGEIRKDLLIANKEDNRQ